MQLKTVCKEGMCTGCMACVNLCGKHAITVNKDIKLYNAIIDTDKCVDCDLCHKACQVNNPPQFKESRWWYQGWANNQEIREMSSSGGFAAEITRSFIRNGGIAISCKFEQGQFLFGAAGTVKEAERFAGSKYIKSDATNAYPLVKKYLLSGKKVLFVGLPCQVAAIKNFLGERLSEQLFTMDLICHGSPDPKVLEIFLKQYHISLCELSDIRFRIKSDFNLTEKYKHIVDKDFIDCYTMAFLKGLCYTDNCYTCQYAQRKRVSDITIGDSWGTELQKSEQSKGISLCLCQTEKGKLLIEQSDLTLLNVDYEKACASNKQLNRAFSKPEKKDRFINNIQNGKRFNIEVYKIFPALYFKILIKMIMKKLKIYRGGVINPYQIIIEENSH